MTVPVFTADSLRDLAKLFDEHADECALQSKLAGTKRAIADNRIQAMTYRQCAAILRRTVLMGSVEFKLYETAIDKGDDVAAMLHYAEMKKHLLKDYEP